MTAGGPAGGARGALGTRRTGSAAQSTQRRSANTPPRGASDSAPRARAGCAECNCRDSGLSRVSSAGCGSSIGGKLVGKASWQCVVDGCDDERVPGSQWCGDCRRYYEADGGVAAEVLSLTKRQIEVGSRYFERRRAGMCGVCGCPRPSVPGNVLCAECAAKGRERMRLRASTRYAQGKCTACNQPRDDDRKRCSACRERDRQRRAAYKVANAER